MKEVFKAMKIDRQDRHKEWNATNRSILTKVGLSFIDKGEALLIRTDKISADFYPSTGRWRSNGKTYSGGAHRFIEWLKKQTTAIKIV